MQTIFVSLGLLVASWTGNGYASPGISQEFAPMAQTSRSSDSSQTSMSAASDETMTLAGIATPYRGGRGGGRRGGGCC